jgi:hypothetical protein
MMKKMRSAWLSVGFVILAAASCGYPELGSPPLDLELLAGDSSGFGNVDGTGEAARFFTSTGVAVDSAGNVYVADQGNHTVRKITAAGVVTTLAGTAGLPGSADGTGAVARFNDPSSVAVDSAGSVYVADQYNQTIRKVTAAGVVTTMVGAAGMSGSADGTGATARFNFPTGVAVDSAGNVYAADRDNHTIRKLTPAGAVTTLAGNPGMPGSADAAGAAARFNSPSGVAVDSAGNVYVADRGNHTIRKVTAAGVVTTLAGTSGTSGTTDDTGTAARFALPSSVAVDSAGDVYVADSDNDTIRKVTAAGVVTTLAGVARKLGSADGTGAAALFHSPTGVAVDSAGNVYVADYDNDTIRKVTAAGVVTTLAGVARKSGSVDGIGAEARFDGPHGVAVDSASNFYVADSDNDTIRKVTAAGVVTTLAGTAKMSGGADGTGAAARFNFPISVAVDSAGNVYVADYDNHTIRKITAAGVATTLAGTAGMSGSADGAGAAARFDSPSDVAVGNDGNLYVADRGNHTIRKVTAAGVVTTLAGTAGMSGSADGASSAAGFNLPRSVAVDSAGNVYVADTDNSTIRKVTAAGVVTTLAGTAEMVGSADGPGAAARFNYPTGVAVDSAGNVYVADTDNSTIRKVTPTGTTTTVAGTAGAAGIVLGARPRFAHPRSLAVVDDSLVISDANAVLRLRHDAQ